LPKTFVQQLQPRKTPQQERSNASVEAILQATVQVLLKDGSLKLTTTRVAQRAGVSVGTLYQYFPNKSALLQALLKQHLEGTSLAVETACTSLRGASLAAMAVGIASAFVKAKFRNIETSVALYAVSDDVEGKRIAREMHARATKAMAALFETAHPHTIAEPAVAAATLLSAMAGVSRGMLEAGVRRETMATLEREVTRMARAYLQAFASGANADENAGSSASGA
jgi:AcrR family transcriptional regulator